MKRLLLNKEISTYTARSAMTVVLAALVIQLVGFAPEEEGFVVLFQVFIRFSEAEQNVDQIITRKAS